MCGVQVLPMPLAVSRPQDKNSNTVLEEAGAAFPVDVSVVLVLFWLSPVFS